MSNEFVHGSGTLVPGQRNSVSILRYLSLVMLNGWWLIAHQSAKMVRCTATKYGSTLAEIGPVLAEVPAGALHSQSDFFELLLRFVVPSEVLLQACSRGLCWWFPCLQVKTKYILLLRSMCQSVTL